MTHRSFAGGAALAVLLASTVAADTPATSSWWDGYERHSTHVTPPDGRRMNLYCEGAGSPTVILESGAGGGAWDWRFLQDAVARRTRVCSYDRAGLGGSDPGPAPRDASAIVADLEQMLAAAKIKSPYVMVGHSLGSYSVRLFTDRHLGDVVGMVLVDPSADHQRERFNAISPKVVALQEQGLASIRLCLQDAEAGSLRAGTPEYGACVGDPPADMPADLTHLHVAYGLSPVHYRTVLSEGEATMSLDSAETTAAGRSLGDLPLVVLTAPGTAKQPGLSPQEQVADFRVWNEMHDELAALSTRGVNRLVPNAGHYIQIEQPLVVIAAINEVIDVDRGR
jgi:pimeloyl-ACP methyl ester carboxylesterase